MTTKGIPYYVTENHYQLEDKPNQIEVENSFDDYYENIFTSCIKRDKKREGTIAHIFRDKSKPIEQFCAEQVAFEVKLNSMTAEELQQAYDAVMYELRAKTSTM